MPGHVKGVLFADYVRMLRAHRGRTLSEFLPLSDLAYLDQNIDLDAWYEMESFERLGLAIFEAIAVGDLGLVRDWAAPPWPAWWEPTSTSSCPAIPANR
jgi:hypothetical protein